MTVNVWKRYIGAVLTIHSRLYCSGAMAAPWLSTRGPLNETGIAADDSSSRLTANRVITHILEAFTNILVLHIALITSKCSLRTIKLAEQCAPWVSNRLAPHIGPVIWFTTI